MSKVKFVNRKSNAGFKLLRAQVVGERASVALEYFRKLCERIGGRVVSKSDVVSCIKETEAIGGLEGFVDEFHSFVADWRRLLDRPIEVVFENRLLGGWSEVASVTYDPEDDEYSVYVRLFSEYGVEPQYVEDVRDELIERRERIPHLGVDVKAEGDVDQNPATDEFVGVAEAWASLPMGSVRSKHVAPELAELVRKAIDLADRVSSEAQERLIIPYREEEGW